MSAKAFRTQTVYYAVDDCVDSRSFATLHIKVDYILGLVSFLCNRSCLRHPALLQNLDTTGGNCPVLPQIFGLPRDRFILSLGQLSTLACALTQKSSSDLC